MVIINTKVDMICCFSLTKNKFVQLAIEKTIKLGCELKGATAIQESVSKGLDVAIVGDNDFYSQRATVSTCRLLLSPRRSVILKFAIQIASLNLPRTLDSLTKIKPFAGTGVGLSDVHKTGLGSSAALITSLVSALLVQLAILPTSAFSKEESAEDSEQEDYGRRLAHNLAQYIHCLAQGKIGSGFDVAAAVFGSNLYTRFDPAVLNPLMDNVRVQTNV